MTENRYSILHADLEALYSGRFPSTDQGLDEVVEFVARWVLWTLLLLLLKWWWGA